MNTNKGKNVILLNWSTVAAQFWRIPCTHRFRATHAHIIVFCGRLICDRHIRM